MIKIIKNWQISLAILLSRPTITSLKVPNFELMYITLIKCIIKFKKEINN